VSDRRPAYTELAEQLRARILSGDLQPGDRLPVEPDLSAQYGVSRSTVREALRVLSSQSLVTTTRGVSGGSFVVHPGVDDIGEYLEASVGLLAGGDQLSVEQLIEVRHLLEVPAAGLAALRRDQSQLEALRSTLIDPGDGGDDVDEVVHQANVAFHTILLEACANPLLSVVSRPLFAVMERRFVGGAGGAGWRAVFDDHARILAAVEARDAESAREHAREHLERVGPTYVRRGPVRRGPVRPGSDLHSEAPNTAPALER
jgi:DNA-binding FadR family transcriptional regulator